MKKGTLIIILIVFSIKASAQIDGGLLLGLKPVTTLEMATIIGPPEGAMLYNTDEQKIYLNTALGFIKIPSLDTNSIDFWGALGSIGTNPAINFLGTIDAQDMVFRANNQERLRLSGTNQTVRINGATQFNNHPFVIRANGDDVMAFQTAAGVSEWHWNLVGNGLNFVESGIADFRIFMEQGGNVGINTGTPDAQLDIESTGVPLRIQPSASTPTGTQDGQIFMGDDGILYAYDTTRSKWLSVDRSEVSWARASSLTTNEYLRAHNSSSLNNGYRMIRDATITAVAAQTDATASWDLLILKNDGNTSITFLTLTNEAGKHANNINIDVNEGDFIQAYCLGTLIVHPLASIEIAWRK